MVENPLDSLQLPYPAKTKEATGLVDGVRTNVMSVSFSDKLLVTIIQEGRLAQWVSAQPIHLNSVWLIMQLHVPMEPTNPSLSEEHLITDHEDSLLPASHFTPKTILGAGASEREMLGQLYASQIASAIATKNPAETRLLVVGLGLQNAEADRDAFFAVLDLVLQCL